MRTFVRSHVLVVLSFFVAAGLGCGGEGGTSSPLAPSPGDDSGTVAMPEDVGGIAEDSGSEDVLRRDTRPDTAVDTGVDGALGADVSPDVNRSYPPLSDDQPDGSFQPQEIVYVDAFLPFSVGETTTVSLDGVGLDAVFIGDARLAFVVPTLPSGEYAVTGTGLPPDLVLFVEEPVDIIAEDGRTPLEIAEDFRGDALAEYADALADEQLAEDFPELAAQLRAEVEATSSLVEMASEEELYELARYVLLNHEPIALEKWDPGVCFDVASFVQAQYTRVTAAVVITLAATVFWGPVGTVVAGAATFGFLAYKAYERGDLYLTSCYEPIFDGFTLDVKSEHTHTFVSGVPQLVAPTLLVELREEDAANVFTQFRGLIAEYGALLPGDLAEAWLSLPVTDFEVPDPAFDGFVVENISEDDIYATLIAVDDEVELTFITDEDFFEDREFTFELVYRGRCQFLACKTELEFRLTVTALLTSTCGNGVVDDWEGCDPTVPFTGTCHEWAPGTEGEVSCTDSCEVDASGCTTVCPTSSCTPLDRMTWVYTSDGVESRPAECRWGGITECVEVHVEGCEPAMVQSAGLPCGRFCDDGSVPAPDVPGATTYGIICHDGLEGDPCNEQLGACDSEIGNRCEYHIDYRGLVEQTRACTPTSLPRNCDTDDDGVLEDSDNACFEGEVCLRTNRGFRPDAIRKACYPSGSTECRAGPRSVGFEEGTVVGVCMPDQACLSSDRYGLDGIGTAEGCYPAGAVVCDPVPSEDINRICMPDSGCFRDDTWAIADGTSAVCHSLESEPVQCNIGDYYWVCLFGRRCHESSPYACRTR